MTSKQLKESILVSDLYDAVLGFADTYGVSKEINTILQGRLIEQPELVIDVLTDLNELMQKLNEHGAWKAIEPNGLDTNDLRERQKHNIKYASLIKDINIEARRLQKKLPPSNPETVAQREERWLATIPCIMTEPGVTSERGAVNKLAEQDKANGFKVPGDPWRAFQRAKKRNRTKNS